MELDPKYCDVILQRWSDLTGKDPVREDGVKWSSLTEIPSKQQISSDERSSKEPLKKKRAA